MPIVKIERTVLVEVTETLVADLRRDDFLYLEDRPEEAAQHFFDSPPEDSARTISFGGYVPSTSEVDAYCYEEIDPDDVAIAAHAEIVVDRDETWPLAELDLVVLRKSAIVPGDGTVEWLPGPFDNKVAISDPSIRSFRAAS